jgi:RecA-family ATPase
MLNIGVAAAEGLPLLGLPEWAVPNKLRVAFVSLEDPADEQLDRLTRLLPFYGLQEAPAGLDIFDRDLN